MTYYSSVDFFGHLCRQLGLRHTHIGLGGSSTLMSEEIRQLSISFASLLHFGQAGKGMCQLVLRYFDHAGISLVSRTLLCYNSAPVMPSKQRLLKDFQQIAAISSVISLGTVPHGK